MTLVNKAWTSPGVFPVPANGLATFVVGNRIFCGGGSQGAGAGTVSSQIWTSTVNADGSLTPWTRAGNMPAPATFHTFIYHKPSCSVYLYGSTSTNPKLYVAKVSGDTVGPWSIVTQFQSAAISGVGLLLVGDWLYMIGGAGNRCDSIRLGSGPIPDGYGTHRSLPPLPDLRIDPGVVICHNHIYVLGGFNSVSPLDRGEVFSARIEPDGNLGPWRQVGNLLQTAGRPSALGIGTRVLVLGGRSGGSLSSDLVQVATMYAGGDIGPFVGEDKFPVAFRAASRSIVQVGKYVFQITGFTTTNSDFIYRSEVNLT